LWTLWRRFRSAQRQENLVMAMLVWSLISTVLAYLVSLMFVFNVVATSIYIVVLITGTIFLVSAELKESVRINLGWPIFGGLLLVGLIFLDIRYLIPAWQIGQYVSSARAAVAHRDYRSANQFYIKAQGPLNPYRWPFLTTYPTFARQYALLIIDKEKNLSWASEIAIDGLRVLGSIQRNEPDRIGLFMEYPILYAVLSYGDPNYQTKVMESFAELTKEFPNHEYLYVNGARALMGLAKYAEAKQVLDKASQFKSVPRELGFWRAVAMIRLEDRDKATIIADLAQSVSEKVVFNDGDQDVLRSVTSYLVTARQLQLATYYQEKLVGLLPQDLTEHSNLLTLYKDTGRLDDVVRVAREIVTLDPTKQAEVQKFLQGIGRSL